MNFAPFFKSHVSRSPIVSPTPVFEQGRIGKPGADLPLHPFAARVEQEEMEALVVECLVGRIALAGGQGGWRNVRVGGWHGGHATPQPSAPSMFLPRHRRAIQRDASLNRGCIATALLTEMDGTPITTVHSIHTAAMYAPYPFANGIDEDIVEQETFEFDYKAKRYHCIVDANRPAPGDGATFLHVRQDGADW